MKLKIAVNKGCKNKTNPQKVAKDWSNIYQDITWLLGWVQAGYGWTATHFVDRHRKAENACGSNIGFSSRGGIYNWWGSICFSCLWIDIIYSIKPMVG